MVLRHLVLDLEAVVTADPCSQYRTGKHLRRNGKPMCPGSHLRGLNASD